MSKVKSESTTTKPRSQRDLLAQLKQLVAASGNEKKFLLAHEALNVDKVGRTTVYDALHGKKIGIKLTALLDAIKAEQNAQTAQRVEEFEAIDLVVDQKLNNRGSDPKAKKTRAAKSTSQVLTRPASAYVKQLQSLIAASGSERKFFTNYAKFNTAGAVRSSVYTAVHDGKVRRALAVMLDGINDGKPITGNGSGKTGKVVKARKAKAAHGVEVLPKDYLGEVENA